MVSSLVTLNIFDIYMFKCCFKATQKAISYLKLHWLCSTNYKSVHIVDQLRWESAMFAFFEPLISVNVSSLLEANYNLGNDRVGECSSANIK